MMADQEQSFILSTRLSLDEVTAWVQGSFPAVELLKLSHDEAEGLGATCASDVAAGDVLLTVPCTVLMDATASLAHPVVGKFVRKHDIASDNPFGVLRGDMEPWSTILLLAYMAEVQMQGACSDSGGEAHTEPLWSWWHYIASLPRPGTIVPPVDALAVLLGRGHPVVARVESQLQAVRAFFEKVPVCAELGVSEECLQWAYECYWSRALRVPADSAGHSHSTAALVPVLDLLNHRPGTIHSMEVRRLSQRTQQGSENEPCVAPTTKQCIVLVAGSALQAGDAMCINYGGKANAELLALYGFCLPENHADYVSFSYSGRMFRFDRHQEAFPVGLLDFARAESEVDTPSAMKGPRLYSFQDAVLVGDGQVCSDDCAERRFSMLDEPISFEERCMGHMCESVAAERAALCHLASSLAEHLTHYGSRLDAASESSDALATSAVYLLHGELACLGRLLELVNDVRRELLPDEGEPPTTKVKTR